MRTPSSLRPLFLAVLFAGASAAAFSLPGIAMASAVSAPPENWEARSLMRDTIFASVREAAAHRRSIIEQATGAEKVSFQPDAQADALYLVFANKNGSGYPLAGAGTFIIKRSLRDGRFLQAKVFVQDDPGCYLRLFPQGDRTVMDIYLFGEPFQMQIALPVAFDRLLTAPLSRVIDLSRSAVDWPMVLAPLPGDGDRRIAGIADTLRARSPLLRDMDDGAMDGSGRMVYIATGAPAGKGGFNCSGFAKWVVDGFFAPLAGHPMNITPLKARDAGLEKTWSMRYEEELDPYFGLDWSRGLAKSIALQRTNTLPTDEQVDVRDDGHIPYVPDVGYPVPSLQSLLYFLARKDTGIMYVGSVNAPSALATPEGTPTLRQHHHVIVLLPWFDQGGNFKVAVFERNIETSLASLQRRYGSEYVHLVRIPTDGPFAPPRID